MPPTTSKTDATQRARGTGGLIKRALLGKRIASEDAGHQLLPKRLALPVFASDALSSVSYATEEIFLVLILIGPTLGSRLGLSLPIAVAVALLMMVVVVSYRQTAMAYPCGGGAYDVSKENLGKLPGLIAGGALLTDYILTVAVSIAAGSFAMASLVPSLLEHRVLLSIGFITLVTVMNLRGVKESGSLFAGPTYAFVLSILVTLAYGLFQCATDGCPAAVVDFHAPEELKTLSWFLVARAFSSGATALTGVEAIVDGVPAFKGRRPEDQARNAATTLGVLGMIAVPMFLGITYLANRMHALPTHEKSLVAQIADGVWSGGAGFFIVQVVTCAILVLAANTAYQDFPRLASVLARDRFLPRQFINRGDRLVFSNGVLVLAITAIALVVIYDAEVTKLIQLYVLGVFTSFTLSQAGMVMRWRRLRPEGWRWRATVNAIGASVTGVVFVIVAISKFLLGAWLIVVAVVLLIFLFQAIHRHYLSVGLQLRDTTARPGAIAGTRVVIPVGMIDEATLHAVGYARAMRPRDITAVHVGTGPHADALRAEWASRNIPVPLEIVAGNLLDPVEGLRGFLRSHPTQPDEVTTLILPELYEKTGFLEVLKRRKALRLKAQLLYEPRIILTDFPVLADPGGEAALIAPSRVIAVVLVSAIHNATHQAVEYARTLSPTDLRAVTFDIEPEDTMQIVEGWVTSVDDVPLEAIESPYRSVTLPLLAYIREIRAKAPDAIVSIVVPEFIVSRFWHQALHNQTAIQIKKSLLFEPGVTLTSVPYHLS